MTASLKKALNKHISKQTKNINEEKLVYNSPSKINILSGSTRDSITSVSKSENTYSDKNISKIFNFQENEIKYFQTYNGNHGIKELNKDFIGLLCKKVLSDWADADINKIQVRDISGHGGSRTYMVNLAYEIIKEEENEDKKKKAEGEEDEEKEEQKDKYEKQVVVHVRKLHKQDPITEPRMEACQKVLYKEGVAVPRIITAKDYSWYIEPYYEQVKLEGEE